MGPCIHTHTRVGVFTVRFGSVFIKKSNQTKIFLKKTETEPKPNQNRFKPTGFGLVWFGFLEKKPVQTGLARFWLSFDSVFSSLTWFFWFDSVLARLFGSVLARFVSDFFPVRFGSVFPVPGLKNRNRTSRFFQNFNRFNRFFLRFGFFSYFFSGFLGLIGFPVFLTPLHTCIYKYMHTHMYVYVCMYVCMYVCIREIYKLDGLNH